MVARSLLDLGIDYFTAYVCENLGSPDECVTRGELAEIAEQEFGSLNVMILLRKPHMPDRPAEAIGQRLFGNPDAAFRQYNIQGTPITVVTDSDGAVLDYAVGGISKDEFLTLLGGIERSGN